MKTTIQLSFTLENKLKAFSSKHTQTLDLVVDYRGIMGNATTNQQVFNTPGLAIFDHGVPIKLNTIISGTDHTGKTLSHETPSVIKSLDHIQGSNTASMDALMSAPAMVIPLLPSPFMVSFLQLAPHSTKVFGNHKEYMKFLTEKMLHVKGRVDEFNSRFSKPLKNGKTTIAVFTYVLNGNQ